MQHLLTFRLFFHTLTLSKSRNCSFNFKGYNVCSLYSCPLSSYTPCSYRQGGKKNIPVSNKSEIHQGPQSVHSPSLVQIVLHSAAQQMHFVHKRQWIKHFRSFFQGGNRFHFFRVLKIFNKEKSCTIDFQARRGKNCITIVVAEQNFNTVKGL